MLGSLTGMLMNTAVVLPALLLGRAIDTALAYASGAASVRNAGLAALLLVAGTLATELPCIVKHRRPRALAP